MFATITISFWKVSTEILYYIVLQYMYQIDLKITSSSSTFCMLFRPIFATNCLFGFFSVASFTLFSIPSSSRSFSILSFHLCLGRSFGLLALGFSSVTCQIIFLNLQTCSAQLNLLLFKTSLIVVSSYRSLIS